MKEIMEHFIVSAPGKVILFGEHAVVYKKAAVAVSLDLRTKLNVETDESKTGELQLIIRNLGVSEKWKSDEFYVLALGPPNANEPRELSPENLQVVERRLLTKEKQTLVDHQAIITLFYLFEYILGRNYLNKFGVKFEMSTDLPIGAGLGSSASYSVCLATALLHLAGTLQVPEHDVALNESDLELINKWAYLAEKIFHGQPSGIDNSICTFGGGLSYKSGTFSNIQMPSDLRILVANTGVPRKTREIVANVRKCFEKYPDILNPIFDAIDQISNQSISTLKNMATTSSGSKDLYETLEDLIKMNHALLRTLGVSHEKLEDIVRTATGLSFSAKLTGAGAGGFAYVLLSPDRTSEVRQLKQELENQGFKCWEVGIGGRGVSIETISTK